MLRVCGRGYVIEYVQAAIMEDMEERRYRAYVTDALMVLTENTQRMFGGKAMSRRWADAFRPADTRTGEEIAADVIRNAGLTMKAAGGRKAKG